MSRARRGALLCRTAALLAAAAPLLTGCAADPTDGYSFSGVYDAEVRTVAVPMWRNQTFSHGMEAALTDAITKEIQRATPWSVSRDNAQTTLTGTITDVSLRKLSTADVSGLAETMAVEITIDYEWRDNRTGRTLVERRGFRAVEAFVPALGVGERVEIGEQAAVMELARDVVASLRAGW